MVQSADPASNGVVSSLPFGRHRGQPLTTVPTDYLRWVVREVRLSSGVQAAVLGELEARNIDAPPPGPARPVRRCAEHPDAEPVLVREEDSRGRCRIRAGCPRCRRWTDYPPCVSPYTTRADAGKED
jgi:hypothetical protein